MANVNLVVGNDFGDVLQGTAGDDLIYGLDPSGPQGQVSTIAATRVASGLTQPLFAGAPPGDTVHLFIVEKAGLIKVLDLASGQVISTPFLDLTGQVSATGEQGALGLAFHPDFASNGLFYVSLINTGGQSEIRRYQVSATDPIRADPATATPVITIDQPVGTQIHKAGWLGFGPDGYLYAALGDGGPSGNSQDPSSLLGKLLRLDVDSDAFPADAARNYAPPPDNPFVGIAGADEIFALGLRNPWRPGFDRGLGDLYIADVGQNTWEEINLGLLGANYGWNRFEGPDPFIAGPLGPGTLTVPIHSYNHNGTNRSVTGGYVYRGESEGLQGHYFFADFITGQLFTLRFDGNNWVATERTGQVQEDIGTIANPSSFAEDGLGNLYVIDLGGAIYRLTPVVASADQGDQLSGLGGNDMMFGGSGNDVLDGGDGNDVINGGAGVDSLAGGNADDIILGGAGNDSMLGGGPGNDVLDGGSGSDAMAGNAGNDTYVVDVAGDTVTEIAGEGSDTVRSGIVYILGPNVENLTLIGGGSSGYGNGLANVIVGNAGNNVLDGMAGADTMMGGNGNDVYFADSSFDVVTEAPGAGSDAVYATATYMLGANLEYLYLQGAANLSGYGNALVNLIQGNAGNNALDGGAGGDTLQGGMGSDAYLVDDSFDQIFENPGEGFDAVYTNATYALGNNLENLYLQGSGDLAGHGNVLVNFMQGNTGNNALDGRGGADVMQGGTGSDAYFVDSSFEVIVENVGEGTDAAYASVNYMLAANVEYLFLQDAADINGYGNALGNLLVGNSGNNALDGGAGADTMQAGAGSDAYFVDSSFDVVTENASEGFDAVYSTQTYVLGANVEHLYLRGSAVGGFGNALANFIQGNAGDNGINGMGSADVLEGNGGNDLFAFNSGQASGDTVNDFIGNGAAAGDSIQFSGFGTAAQGATFTQIGATNQWTIHSGLDAHDETITFANAAAIHASDFSFI
jgi:Ca2+-binding RTX toxin-like protein/glucose/arabinose dehydrogenase